MASGYGLKGRGRCHPFALDFDACYAAADVPMACIKEFEDLRECLTGYKETKRMQTIRAEKQRQEKEAKKAAADSNTRGSAKA